MSDFKLQPLDGGISVIVPPGKTVIGRGPFLSVTDKRVSRNHGILEVVDTQLRIKSTHVNPCFHRPFSKDKLEPLKKDEWCWLQPGDCFSLLPDSYVFRVLISNSDNEQTLGNSQMLDEKEIEANQSDSPEVVQQLITGGVKKTLSVLPIHVDSEEPSFSTEDSVKRTISRKKSNEVQEDTACEHMFSNAGLGEPYKKPNPDQRKRVLPSWMLQGDLEVPTPLTSATKAGGKTGGGRGRGKSATEAPKSSRKRLPSSESTEQSKATEQKTDKKKKTEEGQHTNPEPAFISTNNNKRKEVRDRGAVSEDIGLCVKQSEWQLSDEEDRPASETKPPAVANNRQMSDNEEEKDQPASQQAQLDGPAQSSTSHRETQEKVDKKQRLNTGASASDGSEDTSHSSKRTKQKRTPCIYGKGCYRKNPVHFQEFSHPGDDDYSKPGEAAKEGDEDDSDDRPECPYGTACYRKNPQHKEEYKHTSVSETERRRPKRKAAKKGKSVLDGDSDDDGNSNDYDLNDSFIDDEEEEEEYDHSDEDSDWQPDSEEREDIDTLMKEAKRFSKNQK
ncbi:aprataxin and PNK-like factor isoform X2 [Latimeria chalumnae]|uniref:aprataxin and PNK-like factor isoform X2 n=1 Tax=Latimeria chalumnae TaxID=7897 RepID=UPI00313D8E91